ncbi:MAG: hypothetical protein U1F64_14605 [Burkholderiales bacterium]
MIRSVFPPLAVALAAAHAAARARSGLLVPAVVRDGRFRLLPGERGRR